MTARKRPAPPKTPAAPRLFVFGDAWDPTDKDQEITVSDAFFDESIAIEEASEFLRGNASAFPEDPHTGVQILYELVPRKRVKLPTDPLVEAL